MSAERAALRAFRGEREVWFVASGQRPDPAMFETKREALEHVGYLVACGQVPAVWPVWVEESA